MMHGRISKKKKRRKLLFDDVADASKYTSISASFHSLGIANVSIEQKDHSSAAQKTFFWLLLLLNLLYYYYLKRLQNYIIF